MFGNLLHMQRENYQFCFQKKGVPFTLIRQRIMFKNIEMLQNVVAWLIKMKVLIR